MRVMIGATLAFLLSASPADAGVGLRSANAGQAEAPTGDQGLCRRPPGMISLPPEVERSAAVHADPALPSAEADGEAIMVTGSRIPSRSATGMVAAGSRSGADRDPPAGLLTAGEYDDLLNPQLYARYVNNFREGKGPLAEGLPRIDTRRLLSVRVRDPAGRPVPFAQVMLACADGNSLTLTTFSDGRAVFFPVLDRLGQTVRLSVHAAGGSTSGERTIRLSGRAEPVTRNVIIRNARTGVRRFDLALVIDTTGSMGDEIAYLRSELRSIVAALRRSHPRLDLRVALILYRDLGDQYVTRTFGFDSNVDAVQGRLAAQSAAGGGDYPEAMDQALNRAVALDWRADAIRSIVLVADAPPHQDRIAATWAVAEAARARRIHITPVAASGVGDQAEYVMRAMAAATQSRYLFLTDDSGIGNPHAEPAIDCYLVTGLNALLRRVLDSQISGRRVEPRPGEVIRRVGIYDSGRCVLPPNFDPSTQP